MYENSEDNSTLSAEGQDALEYVHKMNITRVIIDTDAGVDDATALLMALAAPNFDILAITTCSGNTHVNQVVINVLKTLESIKAQRKVYTGSQESILETPPSDNLFGQDGFGDVENLPMGYRSNQKEHAVSVMIKLIHLHPKEVSIIALGPLTNIALAIKMDPSFKASVKHILWIGGSINGVGNVKPGMEFNAYVDPAANFIVFNKPGPPILMVPWELLLYGTAIPMEWRKDVLGAVNSLQIEFLNKIENKSLRSSQATWISADSKTMAAAINPSIIKKATFYHAEAIYEGPLTKGLIIVDYAQTMKRPTNVIIVESMDTASLKSTILQYLTSKNITKQDNTETHS